MKKTVCSVCIAMTVVFAGLAVDDTIFANLKDIHPKDLAAVATTCLTIAAGSTLRRKGDDHNTK